jgi:hypothetical protein
MTRIALIVLALSACGKSESAPAAKPAPATPAPAADVAKPPANLVCEQFAKVNPKATCDAKFTAFGELAAHTAFVTINETQIHCRYDASMTGIFCSDPIVLKLQPPPPTQDAKPKRAPAARPASQQAPKK